MNITNDLLERYLRATGWTTVYVGTPGYAWVTPGSLGMAKLPPDSTNEQIFLAETAVDPNIRFKLGLCAAADILIARMLECHDPPDRTEKQAQTIVELTASAYVLLTEAGVDPAKWRPTK